MATAVTVLVLLIVAAAVFVTKFAMLKVAVELWKDAIKWRKR